LLPAGRLQLILLAQHLISASHLGLSAAAAGDTCRSLLNQSLDIQQQQQQQ